MANYDDTQSGYGAYDAEEVPDVENVDGACPPMKLWYRIYPEENFTALFSDPPGNVIT